ncbi:MAG TPA: hypothetical protein VHB98_16760, partial [Chloroflexota bacterium]|nr:hypothetical protein [Chloroflexota bacterium]
MARTPMRGMLWRMTLIALAMLAGMSWPLPRPSYSRAGDLNASTTTLAYPPPPLLASAAALIDADTGKWLYLSHADQQLAMASTTKIMTAVLAIEHGHLNDLVTISHAAATIGQTTMGLREGERVSMHDLLYGLLLPS